MALAAFLMFGGVSAWRRAHRLPGRWVGRTHCAWFGKPRVEIVSGLARVESIATVAHESVHVADCQRLGPVAYRWNTLFAESNLALEVPAYCAAARVRLANGWLPTTAWSTVLEDMQAAMGDQLDTTRLREALVRRCPDLQPSAR